MKLITFKRHLIESFKSLKRNGWMSIAAISAVTVTLLLVGVLLSILLNINKLARDVENDVSVRVVISKDTKKQDEQKLRNDLDHIDGVKTIKFSSKNQELKNVIGVYGDDFKLFSGDSNPLYDVFIVETKSPKDTIVVAKKAKQLDHVYDARYGGASAKKLFNAVSQIERWGMTISALLLFVAIFLIANTIRITILSRKDEIAIMKLVGATNNYIRWPFVLEGAWTGLLGAVFPIVVVDFGYHVIYELLSNSLRGTNYHLITPNVFLWQIDLLMIMIGMIIGAIGAGLSMGRFLKI